MICDRIRALRIDAGMSQSELAKKLSITRSAVNAWEMGLSAPSAQYIIELAELFHCSADYILELDNKKTINISKFNKNETKLIIDLIDYINSKRK